MRNARYERRLRKLEEWKKRKEARRLEKFLKWRKAMRELRTQDWKREAQSCLN